MQKIWMQIKLISVIGCLVLLSVQSQAQPINLKTDLVLTDSITQVELHHHHKRPYIYKGEPITFRNSNPISLIFGVSLYVYQNYISQHFSADCLYSPSCSDFSKQAVKEYGLFKGGLLTFDRLNRCNRIAATDLNPVTVDKKTYRFPDPIKRYQ